VAAKGGLAGAEPLTFLALRFALVTAIMLGLALVLRRPWPRRRRELLHLAVIGLSMQAIYSAPPTRPSPPASASASAPAPWP
jgi:drug/metabolite transporter (DMT)-like permease